MATEQINNAIDALDACVDYVQAIYPDTVAITYNDDLYPSKVKVKLVRIASDPDIATDQINEAIEALGDVSVNDIFGIYPDTVMIVYSPDYTSNTRVKVIRIASDPDMATEQVNVFIEALYNLYKSATPYIYYLYSDTLIVMYDYEE